jgi:hypothetical protein
VENVAPLPAPSQASGAPQWIEPSIRVAPGADPLGLQTITTDRIMPRLLPGILALSDRARYISFHTFLLARYAQQRRAATQGALSHYIKSREYEYALAVELCRRCTSGPVGANRAGPAVRSEAASFPRNESVDSHLGGYGLYYRSPLRTLGLVAPAGTPIHDGGVTPVDVLWPGSQRAERLAEHFGDAIAGTRYLSEFIDGIEPIPSEVLREYGQRACLCRLDEYPAEQAALREAFFEPSAEQHPEDVASRREGFALWLDLRRATAAVENDDGLRRTVWQELTAGKLGTRSHRRAIERWAGLAAKDFVQEAITNLWVEAGPAMAGADRGDGLGANDLLEVVDGLAVRVLVAPNGETLPSGPEQSTTVFRDAVLAATRDVTLPDLAAWARDEATTLAGASLLFAIIDRIPPPATVGEAWLEIAGLNGERQPGPLAIAQRLTRHLTGGPHLRDTILWLLRAFVLRPHETIAYSKLPEFTFRFRHEGGRLRFYPLSFARFGLNNIRASTLASLSTDLGLATTDPSGRRLTPEGDQLIARAFR